MILQQSTLSPNKLTCPQSSKGHHNQNTIQDKYGSSQVFLVYITAVQASAGLWALAYTLGQDFWLESTNPHWRISSGQVLVTQALFILFS